MIRYATYSDAGGRPCNEDSVAVRNPSPTRLCAVLGDGLGGHGGGQIASAAAVDLICGGWEGISTPELLVQLSRSAHSKVLSLQTPACEMKTTIVILAIDGDRFDWAYAGDSRLYHFLDGRIVFQTRDHSASQIAVMLGQITPEEIRFHEDRSRIFRALGQRDGGEVSAGEADLAPGRHAFLLCSDGFWEYVLESEMESTLAEADSPEDWLRRMRAIHASRTPTDNDNHTAAVIWTEK